MPPEPQTIEVNCVIFGDAYASIFSVDVALDKNVASLTKSIIEDRKPRLDAVRAGLRLFYVNLSVSEIEGLGVGDFNHKLERTIKNEEALGPLCHLRKLFLPAPLRVDHLHIVVQCPADAQSTIKKKLIDAHGTLFRLLQVQVSEFGSWSDDDVEYNMNGGATFASSDSELPVELAEIEQKLVQTRTYARPPAQDWWPGFRIASDPVHAQIFHEIYEEKNDPSVSVKDDQEFLAFSNILERHQDDLSIISLRGSSSTKASHFTVHFIVPPFLKSEESTYKEQTSLGFPIFVTERNRPELMCKFTPKPDFMVASTTTNCPFITSEVVSDLKESDKRRMLLEAIAFARAGQYLTKKGKQFFVIAICLCADMTAERYVVAQIGTDNKVFMRQKNFNLCLPEDSISFLREMYNLAAELKELERAFRPRKTNYLNAVNSLAAKMATLTEIRKYSKASDFVRGVLEPIAEAGDTAGGPADSPSVFDADDIQAILGEMEYKIKFIPIGYPLVAVVSSVTDSSKTGFLKFVPDGRDEIEILEYLSEIDSPRNHTIAGVRFWPVSGGQVISMPAAGSWITHLRSPDAQLWSVAGQLVEAVDFMHQHGVAHLDLKPANILIPLNGGRLSIIDFDASERVNSVETVLSGVVGTRGYIAPEAAADHGVFSAIRADLWSCGRTLSELCGLCRPSADRETLLQIARALMDDDPEKRPMMSEVLKRMASYQAGGDVEMIDLRCLHVSATQPFTDLL